MAQATFGDFEATEEVYEKCICGGTLAKCMGAKEHVKCSECERLWVVAGSEAWRGRVEGKK